MEKQDMILKNYGAVEGTIIVNGRPEIEKADMPTLSFESVDALMEFLEKVKQ